LSDKKSMSKREFHAYSLAWLIILLGWLVVINYLSNQLFYRLDLTSQKAYTLSKSTKNVLKDLKQPVIITAYISSNLPVSLKAEINQIRDLLAEYKVYGRGKVKFNIINPDDSSDLQEELKTRGIEAIEYQVRGASEFSLRRGYLALEINYLDQRQAFPNVIEMRDFEYAVSSTILKLSSEKEIGVGFLAGHNEADPSQQLKALREVVERQYVFSSVSQAEGKPIPEDVNVLLVAGPARVPEKDKYQLDQYLMRGGKIIYLVDGVEVAQEYLVGFPKEDGLDDMLQSYGVKRNHDLVMDVVNEKVAFRSGAFQLVQPYPLWVKINIPLAKQLNLVPDHQIINSLGSVVLPWTSSLELVKGVADVKAITLLTSSPKAWTQTGQFSLDPNKIPPPMPMPGMGEKERPLAVLLQGTFKSFYAGKPAPAVSEGSTSEKEQAPRLDKSADTAILVVGNSKFIRDEFLGLGDSNLDFVLNAIDWMTLGGKLIGVRSRISTDRPFAPEINQCITEGYCTKASFPRLLFARILGPFLLPIAVVIYGLVRFQVHRRSKKSWATAQAKGASK